MIMEAPMERMTSIRDAWAAAAGVETPRFDAEGNAFFSTDGGELTIAVRGGDVYVSADAGNAADCAYPDMLACRLMEAHCMWGDSSGFTYALDDRNHVVLQDRHAVEWFGDGRGFADYLSNLEDARRLARDLIAFGKEG